MMFKRLASALLITTMFLAGCGSSPLIPTASQKTAARPISQSSGGSYALMPVAQGAPNQSSSAGLTASAVRVLGMVDLSEDEIAEDSDETYGLQANDKPKGYSGLLRRTETSFTMEHTTGFFKKTKTLYTIQPLNNDVAASLQGQENRKVLIKAVAQANNTLVVHSVKRFVDLGFLFNWYTKAKIAGTVKDFQGKALPGVIVRAKSTEGYLFTATSEADGEFALKNVTPGTYSVSFVKDGYLTATSNVLTNKRKTTSVEATLVPTN